MTPNDILEDMKRQVTLPDKRLRRVFAGGLLPAFCDFFIGLDHPQAGYASLDDFFAAHPQVTEGANTLTVVPNGQGKKKKSIRPSFERVADFYVIENNRMTFPSAAPHATGQWRDYRQWLETLVTLTPSQLEDLAEQAKDFVLSVLPESKFDPSTVVREPPIFHTLLEQFPWDARRGSERTGAAFQAMVFAFIRADAPHLQVETRRVRTGSSRVKGIGDVDAWEGRRLAISAEVKHYRFTAADVDEIKKFIGKVQERGAMGLVVATSFEASAVELIEAQGLRAVDLADVSRIVALWDPLKQRAALNAFEYAIWQKELSIDLGERLDEFLIAQGYRPASPQPIDDEAAKESA